MNVLTRLRFWFTLILLAFGLAGARAQMPLYGSYYLHDPGTMIKSGASYFIYGDGQGISGITTTDLRNWSAIAAVFPGNPPAWTTNDIPAFTNVVSGTTNITSAFSGYFWAPDIAYFNGRYNLYYSCSQWGTRNSAIGVVTSPSLTSPVWTDQGKVVESHYPLTANADTIAYNCIDPSILVDTNGSVWMSYGSYSDGIVVAQIDPTTGLRLNPASVGTKVASSSLTYDQNGEEGSCLYQQGGYYYLFVNFGGCCSANSTYNIRVGRSATVTGPYLDKKGGNMIGGGGTMVLESNARYVGPGHAAIMNDNGTNWFTYHYYDALNNGAPTVGMNRLYWSADGWPVLNNDWSAFYPFSTNANEHLGLYNGTLQNNTAVTNDPSRGSVLNFDGVTNFVSMPFSVGNASTFAAWVKWNGGGDWQRIFDFGSNTTQYLFLTPRANTGVLRFAIKNGGGEQQINAPYALPTNSWCHVAVTLDGSKGLLYLNGVPIATNNALTIRPWQTIPRNSYLGKSQFATDPLFAGEMDSFRIFGRALSASEIRDVAWAHPALAHRYSFSTNATSAVWDSIGMAHGTLAGSAVLTNGTLKLDGTTGSYANLPGGLVSGSSAVTLEFWATFGGNVSWARVADFGNISTGAGQNYFFFSPHNGSSGQTMEMKINNTAITYAFTNALDSRSVHVVCIADPANKYAAVYTNGVLEASASITWSRFTSVNRAWAFIGRSLFSTDPYLNATIDELRIYDGRLSPQEIAADYQFGPNALALPVTVVQSNTVSGVNLSWPSSAAGFVLETTPALGSVAWTSVPVSPALINDSWQFTIPATNAAQFYRLRR